MKSKVCKKCGEEKFLSEFYKDKCRKGNYRNWCKQCCQKDNKIDYQNNREKRINYQHEYGKAFPWKITYRKIKKRCENITHTYYHRYGGRGIKCLITEEELKELWFRDKAYEMKQPSIDRIDNDGDYIFENCQFIEMKINNSKNRKKAILQFDLEGNFIREWDSSIEASKFYNICSANIRLCARNKTKTSFGFIWKYKNEN